jgi:transcriptional regulator with XRE-family HTH domain
MEKIDSFKNRLNIAIEKSGLTKMQIAEKLGTPRSSITQYCGGKNEPRTGMLEKLANLLNVNPVWLMGYDVTSLNTHEYLFKKSKINDLVDHVSSIEVLDQVISFLEKNVDKH